MAPSCSLVIIYNDITILIILFMYAHKVESFAQLALSNRLFISLNDLFKASFIEVILFHERMFVQV